MGSKENGSHWTDAQVRMFVKDVRKRAGDAWTWMVSDVRRALIAEKALSIICGQDRDTIPTRAAGELLDRMERASGLSEGTSPDGQDVGKVGP